MGTEEHIQFKRGLESLISYCWIVPWDMEERHLDSIKDAVEKQVGPFSYIAAIEKRDSESLVVVEYNRHLRALGYYTTEDRFIMVCDISKEDGETIAEEIKQKNAATFADVYRSSRVSKVINEIPLDRRSIVEIEETGAIISPCNIRDGIPCSYSFKTEERLQIAAFLAGANHVVGYRQQWRFAEKYKFDIGAKKYYVPKSKRSFFIAKVHSGYPIVVGEQRKS